MFRRDPWLAAVLLALLGIQLSGCALPRREIPGNLRPAVDAAIEKVRPALVRIRVVSTDYSDGREIKVQSVGSGAIITEEGYLVTNHHVAGHGTRMFCTLWNREEIEADLVGTDPLTDISVLKLKPKLPRRFATVGFGDSARMRVGDPVLAMGSPMALSQSVTLGIISNTEMMMPRFQGSRNRLRLDGEDVGALVKWIGHDAAIYGGNSGGPLVNLDGDIIGINEISYGLGGAIPGNLAKSVAEELIASGRVRRSWVGVDFQPLFKSAEEENGVLISGVYPDSPADRAGFKPGDLLLELAETKVAVRYDEQMPDLMQLTTSLPIGQSVPAVIKRGDKLLNVQVVPDVRGEVYPKQQELKQWGLTARNVSVFMAKDMKRNSLDGAVVTSVRAGGPAGEAKPELRDRDVIVEVNDTPVKSVRDLQELTRRLTAGKTDRVPVVVTFERKAARYLAVVRIGIQELRDPGLEVTKAWLPVETHVISREIATQLGQPSLRGFYITRVYPGTTAEKAGLQSGDFIVSLDGERLTASAAEHEDELATLVRQYDVGKTVELTVLRDQAEKKINVELARSPRLKREMKKYRNDDFEFTARDVSFFDAAEEQWEPDQTGALVEDVRSGSWAELGSLQSGDLILRVDGHPIENVDSLRKSMEQIVNTRKSVVTMKVLRGARTTFLELEPDWKN